MAVMTQADLARLLGVSRSVVHMWHQRRRTSGFPSMVAQTIVKRAPLFDVDAVVDWYSKRPARHGLPDPRTVKRNPRRK